MGMLISGKWNKQKIKSRDGRFGRRQSQFRDKLTADGSSRFNTKGGPCRLYIDAILALALALMVSCAAIASAQEAHSYSRASFGQWLANNTDAKPDFKPGDVLTAKDLERVRPFMVPGYFDQLNFPELRMEIIAPRSHTPQKDFVECTEKYQAQVKLKADGTLENYVCGQPFSDS